MNKLAPAARRTLATRLYRALGPVFDELEKAPLPAVGPYPAAAVRRRLLQRAAESQVRPLMEAAARGEPEDLAAFAAAGVSLRPGPRLALRCAARFAAHWLANLLFFARAGADPRPAALLSGVGAAAFSDGGDAAFTAYCRRGPVAPLSSAPRLIVESKDEKPSPSDASVSYHPRLLPALHASLPRAGGGETAAFLIEHLRALCWFASNPSLCELWKDLAYHALAASLDRRGAIAAVLLTNSDYDNQPLWQTDLPGRRFETHILWYSTNIVHHVYKDAPVAAMPPHYRYLKVDRSWTWSEDHSAELDGLGIKLPHRPVGPIVWALESRRLRPAGNAKRVGLFDVTPVEPEWARRHGVAENYYSPEVAAAFLEDSAAACRAAGAVPLLKPKRGHLPYHARSYVELVDRLAAGGAVTLAGPEGGDLFGFISTLDLVIVAPFSSPARIAAHLGVPSLYYDPTGLLVVDPRSTRTPVAASPEALGKALQRML